MSIVRLFSNTNAYQATDAASFRHWQVEALLNQAADLFDRCDAQRSRLLALEEKRAELTLRISDITSERGINQQRVATDWFYIDVNSLREAEQEFANVATKVLDARQQMAAAYEQAGGYQTLAEWREKEAAHHQNNAENTIRLYRVPRQRAEADRVVAVINTRQGAITDWLSYVQPNGILYLDQYIDALSNAIEKDFKDGYNRASVAAVGLNALFGYTEPLPLHTDVGALPLLDMATQWARDAIRHMAAFLQYDQTFVRTISVRRVLGAGFGEKMTKLKNTGQTSFDFKFPDEDLHRYVRFRGLSATLVGSRATLSAEIELPEAGLSVQWDGNREVRERIVQDSLPPCYLGRIEDRTVPRAPEVAGTNSLINASPLGFDNTNAGKIRVSLTAISEDKDFEDLLLEFALSGRPN